MSVPHSELLQDFDRSTVGRLSSPTHTLREMANRHEDGYLQAIYNGVAWRIYFRDGKLQHAASSFQSKATLDYHFRCVGVNTFAAANEVITQAGLMPQSKDWMRPASMIAMVNRFQNQGYLNFLQGTRILENLAKEAIESFLWLTEGHYQWIKGEKSTDKEVFLESNLELESLLRHFQDRMQAWQEFGALIKSPHQRPYLFSQGSHDTTSPDLHRLSKFLRGMSIRQLALALNQDEIKIAKRLLPFVERGEVYLHYPQKPYQKLPDIPRIPVELGRQAATIKTFKVACVDDSATILDEMHRFLNHDEYEVTKIDDPVRAAAVLFRLKPDLILMDITMPEINGYKLCSLLRNSVACRETPIVMVTGRAGLIDKARAKVAGATDYLVKPFTRGSLLAVVEKYLQ